MVPDEIGIKTTVTSTMAILKVLESMSAQLDNIIMVMDRIDRKLDAMCQHEQQLDAERLRRQMEYR